MKLYLILSTVFLLAIHESNAWLLSLYFFEGECFGLVKQYYQCRLLNMTKSMSWFYTEYVPNSNIPNNTLTDAHFKNLTRLSFDDGMNLIRRIYVETNNCTSEFCNCVNFNHVDFHGYYSIFFRNSTNYAPSKSILGDFIKKHKSQLLPREDLDPLINSFGFNLPSLTDFCINVEWSWLRLHMYDKLDTCVKLNQTLVDSCLWSVTVVNRTLITKPSNALLEKELSCYLLEYTKCGVERQRLQALVEWAAYLPDLRWSGNSLATFFDRIIAEASSFKPRFLFAQYSLSIDKGVYTVDSYRNKKYSANVNATNSTLLLFRSQLLALNSYTNNTVFTRYNIIFYLNSSLPTKAAYNVTVNSKQQATNNGIIATDQNKQNIFQLVQDGVNLEVFDFNSNSRIRLRSDSVYLETPAPEWLNSAGVLVDAFNRTKQQASQTTTLRNFITLNVYFS